MEEAMPEFEGSTHYSVIRIPWPWPPESDIEWLNAGPSGLTSKLVIARDGRVRASLLLDDGSIVAESVLVRIFFQSEGYAILALRWNPDKTADFFIDGKRLTSDDDKPIAIDGLKPTIVVDEDGINRAQRRRKDLRRSLKENGPLQPQLRNRIADLRQQLHEIDGLLALQTAGHSVETSLASKLRILVGEGKGNGLVQEVAALANLPLLVYAAGGPSREMPMAPSHVVTSWSMSNSPDYASAQTDLSVWLEWEAMRLGEEVVTHKQLIKAIADQRGAHIDRNPSEALLFLLNGTEQGRTSLLNYVGSGAAALWELGNRIVAEADALLPSS